MDKRLNKMIRISLPFQRIPGYPEEKILQEECVNGCRITEKFPEGSR
jgi:hypothetical protein